jgi:hypothetical protein
MGRPSDYTEDLAESIVEQLCDGKPLAEICRADGMPTDRTVRNWMEKDAEFSSAIARARVIGFDAIAADALRISDNVKEDPASRRVRADTRLKLLAKWDPKRYGDKLDLTSGGEKIDLDDIAVATRLAAIFSRIDQRHDPD